MTRWTPSDDAPSPSRRTPLPPSASLSYAAPAVPLSPCAAPAVRLAVVRRTRPQRAVRLTAV
ncbi:hypothetical protein ACFY5C_33840 [Streptomyces sp. NPDC012935]|uniref:hypothetical protein n=1 Tax=Streptomyces sp. NPDC012935 TaxID=3364857 RepID=UPI003694D401